MQQCNKITFSVSDVKRAQGGQDHLTREGQTSWYSFSLKFTTETGHDEGYTTHDLAPISLTYNVRGEEGFLYGETTNIERDNISITTALPCIDPGQGSTSSFPLQGTAASCCGRGVHHTER